MWWNFFAAKNARAKAIERLVDEMTAVINFDYPTNLDLFNCEPPVRVVLVEKSGKFGMYVIEDDGAVQEVVAPVFSKIERYDPDYPGNPKSPVVMVTTHDGWRGFASLDKGMGYGTFVWPANYHQLVLVMYGPEGDRAVDTALVARNPGDQLVKYQR